MMWSELYRPSKIEDLIGNEEARMDVVNWLLKWVDGAKPLFLMGPPGVGKTTIVKVLANQYDYDLIEMNASDTRNKDVLTETILPILRNRSLISEKVLLFLDEIDGISGRQDAGGIEFLSTLLKESPVPIILAANIKDTKLKPIAKLCRVVEFNRVHSSLLQLYLERILEVENIQLKEIHSIVRTAKGDIRYLLNIAQAKISGYNSAEGVSTDIEMSQAIPNFFTSPSVEDAVGILMNVEGRYSDPHFGQSVEEKRKDILYAFFSSIVNSDIEFNERADALDLLSRCDLIVGRVFDKRYWTLLRYLNIILSYGLYYKLAGHKINYNRYSQPWPISAPIISRRIALRRFIVNLARLTHTSVSVSSATYLHYLFNILLCQKVDVQEFAEHLGLDPKAAEPLSKEILRV